VTFVVHSVELLVQSYKPTAFVILDGNVSAPAGVAGRTIPTAATTKHNPSPHLLRHERFRTMTFSLSLNDVRAATYGMFLLAATTWIHVAIPRIGGPCSRRAHW
jgi:hypothetical protein